ncbi:quaternary amine ABC transporter ATP-binding protein [Pseudaestuariivita sp.]|uniref:quaternary amine ABC transporter ATP-binding protein n=1 Tax=Pseudaestuariivita sp. TaxID=2211669 RepID=UPI0040584DF4
MVFGEGAARALSATSGDAASRCADLRAQGLIPGVGGVSFDVKPGELFVIMGLSGSGKSTLIRCLSRLSEPTAGQIHLEGEDILKASKARMTELRRDKLGMVFQHFGLFPHMSVAENVAFPLKMQGASKPERLARAAEVLRMVDLEGRDDAYPRQLSGGQRQRVGIARSLAVNPDIWFLDEPFSALDPLIRRQLQDTFLNIQAKLQKTIVFITHDIAEALKLADRIAIMRDGQIVQIGTPTEIVLTPADDYVREFSRDVARGQHARVETIMQPAQGASGEAIRTDMTLDEALGVCCRGFDPVPVQNSAGEIIGQVHPRDLAAALRPDA